MPARDTTAPPHQSGSPQSFGGNAGGAAAGAMDGAPPMQVAEALRENWLEIWYQPKIDLRRKCLAGAEALARIHHPTLGVLLPQTFLGDVDDGMLTRLTEHALLTTLRDWTTFDSAGFNLHLAINVPV